ncbi:hypothetical protein Pint_14394 [Pistacia integerrima]|uniref:Uncharacterized protein n=1 Tax=Pistacia integerrima TaxID=434235 RepID=A0ACC0Y6R7_9ROSI|nr:hypothetical protein Pint_14394 [Pistacia integerrima]
MAVFLSGKVAVFFPHRVNLNPGLSSLDSLKFIGTLKMNGIVRYLRFANDSQQLLTSGSDGWIYRWDLRTITCIHGAVYEDFPRHYSKREKKPFPVPVLELRRRARERTKNRNNQPRRPIPPPKRGLLVKHLIPVAYDVLNARITLINNLKKLLKVVPVHACVSCTEIHVGPVGHPFKSCKGPNASLRKGLHEWTSAALEDIFQNFPQKGEESRIVGIAKREFVDTDESELPDPGPPVPLKPILTEIPDSEIVAPSDKEEIVLLAEETLQAWEKMRTGALKLMKMYQVRVCGYCPEVHVGPSGHKAQNCGAFKHQQWNGQHGWQAAVLDDLIPPRYVWHVPDVNGPPLQRELRSFYGQAPAVVEICVKAGAAVPDQYKSTMRLDIGIPSSVKEAEMVV